MATRACLIDVYDTILTSDFQVRAALLAGLAGVPTQRWAAEWLALSRERDLGVLTMARAFAQNLEACGVQPDPGLVDRLVARDAELIISATRVFDDVAPFLTKVRAEGIGIALVSNCAGNTRPMLAAEGLLDLVDAAILSCEVGAMKPDPEIYLTALRELGAPAGEAVFLDDQPRFCAAAAALGVRAIQVIRPGATRPADPLFNPVTSLLDALSLLLSRCQTNPWSSHPPPHVKLGAMTTSGSSGPQVVIVGGGISGLAAAFFLRDATVGGAPVRVTVLEGSPRLGGKLSASEVAGVSMDEGAEALLARRPEGIELITAMGRGGELVPAGTTSSAIWTRGEMRALPRRQFMGVPADIDELAATGVISPEGVVRARREQRLDRHGDISVAAAVGGALGTEVVDRLVDPLLGGVYAGRSEDLSFEATLAPLAAASRTHPALTSAVGVLLTPGGATPLSTPRDRGGDPPVTPLPGGTGTDRRTEYPPGLPPTGPGSAPVFVTLTAGLGTLPAAVAAASGAQVRTRAMVRGLARTASGWRLVIGSAADPDYLEADAVILACPAAPAGRLLAQAAPVAATALAAIPYASTAIITLAYKADAFPDTTRSGYLVPAVDGKAVKAATFSTVKWPHLATAAADAGSPVHIARCSVGRIGEVALLQRDDTDLIRLAAAELAEATGITGGPIESRVTRWGGGLPQYNVGHLDRVARIRAAVAGQPGLAVAGAAFDGVGIPACISTAATAAAQVLAHLGANP